MANPRSIIRALDKHWEVIEYLILTLSEQSTWESKTLLVLMKRFDTKELPDERLQQLVNAEILVKLPRSDDYELNSIVRDFVSQLLNEHQLGLSSDIKNRIDEINIALEALHLAMYNNDTAMLIRGIKSIEKLLSEITKQLQHDTHAIADIVERAKTADNQMPLARRYQEVLDTYERYIVPMTELMDTGASGKFYPLLEQTETVLNALSEQLATQGALIDHQRGLRVLNARVKELQRIGRETLTNSSATITPLRDEYRRHNNLSTAVARLLGEVRKRGLKYTFADSDLPLWRKEQPRRITVDDSLKDFIAQVRDYQPKTVVFPDLIDDGETVQQEWLDEAAIEQSLLNSLPITDLMHWLIENYGQYQDASLIKLYHRLIRLPTVLAVHQNELTRHELKHHAIQLYSHSLTAHEPRP